MSGLTSHESAAPPANGRPACLQCHTTALPGSGRCQVCGFDPEGMRPVDGSYRMEELPPPPGWRQAPDGDWRPPPPSPRRMSTYRWAVVIGAVVVFLLVAVIAAAGVLGFGMMLNDPALHTDLDFGQSEARAPVAFGQTQTRANGNSVTVYSLELLPQGDPGVSAVPGPGMAFAAVDVEECATVAAEQASGWFSVGTGWQEGEAVRSPALPIARPLAKGECVRGWVLLEFPSSAHPTTVEYDPSDSDEPSMWWH